VFNIGAFRTAFPEFSDTVKYPDQMVTFWSTIATNQVNCRAWKNMYSQGVQLYTAHELVLAAQNVKVAANGGSPGGSAGIAVNKTVGSVSVGYDAATTTEKDAGYWNQTTYGKQFFRLAMLFGAGAIQLVGGFPRSPYYGNIE
jgi:hypothetical protein